MKNPPNQALRLATRPRPRQNLDRSKYDQDYNRPDSYECSTKHQSANCCFEIHNYPKSTLTQPSDGPTDWYLNAPVILCIIDEFHFSLNSPERLIVNTNLIFEYCIEMTHAQCIDSITNYLRGIMLKTSGGRNCSS